jgi:hypothetical protein
MSASLPGDEASAAWLAGKAWLSPANQTPRSPYLETWTQATSY